MVKKRLPQINDREEVDIIIESEQWENPAPPPRFTWKHGLILALILGVGILFAFGFLIIAGIVVIAAVIIQIFLWVVRKIS